MKCEWYDLIRREDAKEDEDLELEYAAIEEYKEKYEVACVKYEVFLNKVIMFSTPGLECPSPTSCRKLTLCKLQLEEFCGEVKDCLGFWSHFGRIHDDVDMTYEDKFHYLIQVTVKGLRAREIVDSLPQTAENYSKVTDSLKNRFGWEKLLIEFYVRKLLGLVVKNATSMNSGFSILQIYDKLELCLRALESTGMTSDK